MSTKRIILSNGSRLLREMLHRVINKADNLEVVQEVANHENLPFAIEIFDPEWVIISLPFNNNMHDWIDSCISNHPTVRFILLFPGENKIKMKWRETIEEDLSDVSLNDLIHMLEKDLQHT